MMTKHIFEARCVLVIIHSSDNTSIVYELQAHLISLYGLPATMATKNK